MRFPRYQKQIIKPEILTGLWKITIVLGGIAVALSVLAALMGTPLFHRDTIADRYPNATAFIDDLRGLWKGKVDGDGWDKERLSQFMNSQPFHPEQFPPLGLSVTN